MFFRKKSPIPSKSTADYRATRYTPSNKTVTYFDNSKHYEVLKKVTCSTPFTAFHINPDGNIANCCFYWMPTFIGNITETSLLKIIDGTVSREAKQSVQDGSFKMCDSNICPVMIDYIHAGKVTEPLMPLEKLPEINQKKLLLFLDYDQSCNLYCGSCRNERILHSLNNAPAKLLQIHEAVTRQIQELLEGGYQLTLQITSSGDGFASPFYWSFLQNIKQDDNFKIRFATNGTLMTRERLMHPYAQKIDHIEVSIDAACESTYEKIRRGGNFKALVKNLNNLDSMISNRELTNIGKWNMNFVVQKDNYKEMADFARWALSYKNLNRVWYLLIYDWGHLSPQEFASKAVWYEDHPEHQDFLTALKDPVFDDPRIFLGNVGAHRKKAFAQI